MLNEIQQLQEKYDLLEDKYAEKSFKFLTVYQITKSIAKENSIPNLKKLILDMLFEVSLVKRGLCFEIKNSRLNFIDIKNMEDFSVKNDMILESRENEINFLENVTIVEIKKLNEQGILPEIFGKFNEGYCLTFLGNNESFETMFIVLGEKAYGDYSEVDNEFLVTIRGQVEIILENTIKNDMIEKKNKELLEKNFNLSLINEFSATLGSTLDMKTIYFHIKRLIQEKFNTNDVIIYSYDDESKILNVEKDTEEKNVYKNIELIEYDEASITLSKGIVGVLNGLYEVPKVYKVISEELDRNKNKGLDYIIPLISNINILGLIAFKTEAMLDIALLETLKQQISMYVYNGHLYTMAITDSMTKLYLQTHFKERIESEVKRFDRYNHEFSLIIMDIDHFKKFNDSYGHLVGDYVIKEVAKIIKASVRTFDIVARYGGEEFGVILLNTGTETAVMVAERIRTNIEKKIFSYGSQEMKVTISGGVANVRDIEIMENTEIIRVADHALYESKHNGRNRITLYKKEESNLE